MDLLRYFKSIFSFHLWMFIGTLITHNVVDGQSQTITVPEGIYVYPKVIAQIDIASSSPSTCFIHSIHFSGSNGLGMPYKPRLFGVQQHFPKSNKTKRSVLSELHFTSSDNSENASTTSLSTTTENITSYGTEYSSVATTIASTAYPISTSTVSPNSTSTSAMISSTAYPTSNSTVTPNSTSTSTMISTVTANSTSIMPHTTEPSYVTTPDYFQHAQLVQLFDLDREKADKHLVTVHCFDENKTDVGDDIILIKVSDINDHTPVFEKSSLRSLVSLNTSSGDSILQVKATDADTGLNALLRYGKVPGSERFKYPNETNPVHSLYMSVAVLPSGFVLLTEKLYREVTITFKVTVKDRGDEADGNRATATATVSLYGVPPTPSSKPHTISWWIILCSCLGGVCVVIVVVLLCLKYRRRRQLCHTLLVLTEDHEEELGPARTVSDGEDISPNSRLELAQEAFG